MYKMVHAVYNTEVDVQVYNSLSKEQNEGTNLNDLIKTALYACERFWKEDWRVVMKFSGNFHF